MKYENLQTTTVLDVVSQHGTKDSTWNFFGVG